MTLGKLIYVVEDSEIIREIVSAVFAKQDNTTVKSFGTGEEMFFKMSDDVPNLIILDYYLDMEDKKAMDGHEIINQLKKKGIEAPIIVLTGLSNKEKVKQLKEVGVVDILHKNEDGIISKLSSISQKYL